jgi:hypothetical protein
MMRRSDDATDATEKRKKVAAAAFDTLLWQVEHFLSIVYPVNILKRENWG